MFEKWRIKEHMEVADSTGRHIGTVDEIEDDQIKLTRTDSADGAHHYVAMDAVERIDDNRVYLKAGTPLPSSGDTAGGETVGASAGSGLAGSSLSEEAKLGANYAGSAGAQDMLGEDHPLFGTSGHGTGMGGSGAN